MTDNEKKLLQAKHRLEEAQMRDRQKERKARTRRLIQEGAILEKVYPPAANMDLTKLEELTGRDMNQLYDLYAASGGNGISMQESTLLFAQLIANRVTGYPMELIENFSAKDSFRLKNRVYRFFFLEA